MEVDFPDARGIELRFVEVERLVSRWHGRLEGEATELDACGKDEKPASGDKCGGCERLGGSRAGEIGDGPDDGGAAAGKQEAEGDIGLMASSIIHALLPLEIGSALLFCVVDEFHGIKYNMDPAGVYMNDFLPCAVGMVG